MLQKIKTLFGNYFLQKEIKDKRRDVSVFNLEKAKSVGIIFEASNVEDFELVKRYVNYLKEWKKKVKVIGFFSTGNIPSMTYSKLEYDFFIKKDVNWWGKPNNLYVNNFLEENWDVFIDLNLQDHFPLKYISSMSKAKFKIGIYSAKDAFVYDMMIETDKSKGMKFLLRQVDTYLQMINKKEENNTNQNNT